MYLRNQTDDGDLGADNGEYDSARMKSAVWIDLVNMLLWFATGLYETIKWGGEMKNLRRVRKLKEEASRGMPQEEGMLEGERPAEDGDEGDMAAPPPYEDELEGGAAYAADTKKKVPLEK